MKLKFPQWVTAGLSVLPLLGWTAELPSQTPSPAASPDLTEWCTQVKSATTLLKWKVDPCQGIPWRVGGTSSDGRPLVYAEFGESKVRNNTTLIFSAVHGDEITPLYVGIEVARWMKDHESQLANTHVVIAPMVNPDGFFRTPRTRMNAHGVDVNRNFLTKDWETKALSSWKTKLHSDPRRFPGAQPRSEPETIFQEDLIKKFQPQKLLSIHAPLNHLDYDGPTIQSLSRFPREYVRECIRLRKKLRAVSSGYFPGSLGNFAGNELGIPTITLELPSADANKADGYWKHFSHHIKNLIEYVVPNYASGEIVPKG